MWCARWLGSGFHRPDRGFRCELRAFLSSVAAGLPREHRARVTGQLGGTTRLDQPPVPVAQQRPGDRREPQVQHREDEQLIPEHMAAIGLTMQPARRDADVQILRCCTRPSAADASGAAAVPAIRRCGPRIRSTGVPRYAPRRARGPSSISANRPCRPSRRSAPAAGSDVATSRPVTNVTIFSTTSDWPSAISAKIS